MSATPQPLGGLDFALVGPGRVGSSLALWAVARGACCVSVAGRAGSGSAAALAARLGTVTADSSMLAAPEARLILIAVPDAQIVEIARRLAGRRRASAVALHVAGAVGATALEPLSQAGWRVGSFHPLRAFPTIETDVERALGTFFALDGDAEARALGRRLAEAFGGNSAVIAEADRPLYHWAASTAAGGVVTLLATAVEIGRRLGLPAEALAGYGNLAHGALRAALTAPEPSAAMTGPIARGDVDCVERQLFALSQKAPELVTLAVELARAGLAAIERAGSTRPAAAEVDAALDASRRALTERLSRTDLLDRAKDRVLTSDRAQTA